MGGAPYILDLDWGMGRYSKYHCRMQLDAKERPGKPPTRSSLFE